MSTFFKALSLLLVDRQEFKMTATKIKDDLVLSITPDFKGKGKIHNITVPAEDLNDEIDSKIFGVLNGPAANEPAKFQHAATDAPDREEEEEDDDPKKDAASTGKSSKKKPSAKASPAKKAPAKKKPAVKKEEPKKEEPKAAVSAEEAAASLNTAAETAPASETSPAPQLTIQEDETSGPSNEEIFESLMADGKNFMGLRKYVEAHTAFEKALKLFPENELANKEYKNATNWVKAVANL